MRHILALTLALGLLAGCEASPASERGAYAVVAAYTAVARAEAAYVARPDAEPQTVARLRRLDNAAYAAMREVRSDAQAGRPVSAARLAVAQAAVDDLRRAMAEVR